MPPGIRWSRRSMVMAVYDLGGGATVRICRVLAWDDPQWCAANGLPDPHEQRRRQASERGKRAAETRARKRRALGLIRGGGL